MHHTFGDFRIAHMAIRYSQFFPKLYNYCLSLGFQRSRIMPSRAFCSDESQGYPVILLTQHFGTFPFDHGRVGGKVATDRHGPYAHHGEDLVIIQASHVGYDPDRKQFGVYQRTRTKDRGFGTNCGKLSDVLDWYQYQYSHARNDITLGLIDQTPAVFIDNSLLDHNRTEGLSLHLECIIDPTQSDPLRVLSTSKAFAASPWLLAKWPGGDWPPDKQPIGDRLSEELISFRRHPVVGPEGYDLLEEALAPAMPALVTSANPALDAARYHTQIEFDRTYRSIQRESAYRDKNLVFVSGLNVDVSPRPGLPFPLTKFVPWAAYARLRDGTRFLLEQDALFDSLSAQPAENADRLSYDLAIDTMAAAEQIELPAL
jgi:hypothetical protein